MIRAPSATYTASVLAIVFGILTRAPAGQADEISLRERLQPVAHGRGLRMDGYFVWCGSVIKVGETYHMFASRWPAETNFPDGYRTHSEIVRATTERPEGPYTFQEVVVGKRPDAWIQQRVLDIRACDPHKTIRPVPISPGHLATQAVLESS